MAGIKINNFSETNKNLTALMATEQAMTIGHFALSLSEMESTGYPVIKAGSIIEIGGSLYHFTSDETITNTLTTDGKSYIKLVPSESGLTATTTTTAPIWSPEKRGWYGIGASVGHRYICKMSKVGTSYTAKLYYDREALPMRVETKTFRAYIPSAGNTNSITVTFSNNVKSILSINMENYGEGTTVNFNIYGNQVIITSVLRTGSPYIAFKPYGQITAELEQ